MRDQNYCIEQSAQRILRRMHELPSRWIIEGDRQTGKSWALARWIYENYFAPERTRSLEGVDRVDRYKRDSEGGYKPLAVSLAPEPPGPLPNPPQVIVVCPNNRAVFQFQEIFFNSAGLQAGVDPGPMITSVGSGRLPFGLFPNPVVFVDELYLLPWSAQVMIFRSPYFAGAVSSTSYLKPRIEVTLEMKGEAQAERGPLMRKILDLEAQIREIQQEAERKRKARNAYKRAWNAKVRAAKRKKEV